MGCPTFVYIGNSLKFSITTHDPDTGVLTDADSAPTYRVYEDETATAILTGTMAKLDDANTTGFYTKIIDCTVANGFENNKTYTIYIEATVDGDTGGICFDFTAYTTPSTATEIADAMLNRDMSAVSDTTDRSPLNALRFLRNKWVVTGTTLSVKKENDSTEAWSATVSTNASADPITGNDPA